MCHELVSENSPVWQLCLEWKSLTLKKQDSRDVTRKQSDTACFTYTQ